MPQGKALPWGLLPAAWMGIMASLLALNNARTTFQRVSDAKFLSGWVKEISPYSLIVYTCTDCRIDRGDEFAFQVFGNGHDAFFRGKVLSAQGVDPGPLFSKKRHSGYSLEVECEIEGQMTFQDSRGQARFFVNGFSAQISKAGEAPCAPCTVLDLGPMGFSVITETAYRKGDKLAILLHFHGQTVECNVEVRNCIAYPLDKDYNRVGMQITGMSRVDLGRWKDIYISILDASKIIGLAA